MDKTITDHTECTDWISSYTIPLTQTASFLLFNMPNKSMNELSCTVKIKFPIVLKKGLILKEKYRHLIFFHYLSSGIYEVPNTLFYI
jgi:hypothetical protein